MKPVTFCTALAIAVCLNMTSLICFAADPEPAYSGNWQSRSGAAAGTFSVHLKNENGKLDGDIRIDGSPLTKGGRIQGTVSGADIKFGVVDAGHVQLRYEGTLNGKQMQGIYTASAGRIVDQGSWQATATDAPSPTAAGAKADDNAGLDLSRGIKCTLRQTNMIYYFKGDKIRFESPARIPGITTYDLQIGDAAYYKIVVAPDGPHAGKQPVRLTFDQWYRKVVTNFQTLKGKPGGSMSGAPRCECLDLPDKLFAVPR